MDEPDAATTRLMIQAALTRDEHQLRALAAAGNASQAQLSMCLASLLLTSDGAPRSAAMLRCLLRLGADPNARVSPTLVCTSRLLPPPITNHLP